MTHLSRRSLLLTTIGGTAVLATVGLAGCTNGGTNADLIKVASYANAIATGLKNVLPQLGSITGISAGIMGKVGQDVADIQTLAVALQTTASTNAALPMVQRIEAIVADILTALGGLPLPAPVSTVIAAINVLLPIMETIVGIVLPAGAASRAAAAKMTEAQAVAVLTK